MKWKPRGKKSRERPTIEMGILDHGGFKSYATDWLEGKDEE